MQLRDKVNTSDVECSIEASYLEGLEPYLVPLIKANLLLMSPGQRNIFMA